MNRRRKLSGVFEAPMFGSEPPSSLFDSGLFACGDEAHQELSMASLRDLICEKNSMGFHEPATGWSGSSTVSREDDNGSGLTEILQNLREMREEGKIRWKTNQPFSHSNPLLLSFSKQNKPLLNPRD